MTDRERFNRYVDSSGECWLWTGRLDKDGYAAQFKIGSRTQGDRRLVRPHRWAYEQQVGEIPPSLVIDHLCRVRHCVNPFHMDPVTPAENTRRGARATATHCSKGHPLELLPSGRQRRCLTCRKAYALAWQRASGWRFQNEYKARIRAQRRG